MVRSREGDRIGKKNAERGNNFKIGKEEKSGNRDAEMLL